MGTQRTTFDKLQRERAKKAKAAAKRERRHKRTSAPEAEAETAAEAGATATIVTDPADAHAQAAVLLERIEDLHKRFDAGLIKYEDFEEQKIELFETLAALPID